MTLRAVIVDDESLARKRILRLLASEPDIAVIGECASGREAIKFVRETVPDLLFLDIQMPGMDGFEVLQSIADIALPAIIFTTAYDEYAVEAFEVHALDYLLKPFKQDRFRKALDRARLHLTGSGAGGPDSRLRALIGGIEAGAGHLSRFMIKSADRIIFVKASEVDWIEAAANYALLHVNDKTHLVRETMQVLEARLCAKTFQRVSRSAIINLERVKELRPVGKGQYVIILTNGERVAMTRGIRDLQNAIGPS